MQIILKNTQTKILLSGLILVVFGVSLTGCVAVAEPYRYKNKVKYTQNTYYVIEKPVNYKPTAPLKQPPIVHQKPGPAASQKPGNSVVKPASPGSRPNASLGKPKPELKPDGGLQAQKAVYAKPGGGKFGPAP